MEAVNKELARAAELEAEVASLAAAHADPAAARAAVREFVTRRNTVRTPDDIEFEPVDAGGVPAEWVRPPLDPERRVVIFVHGGGWLFGSPAESRELTARLARAAQARVLALDVRLAPEHPFPAPIDDVLTAFDWLIGDGADPREVAIVGESTGATVALSAVIRLLERGAAGPGAVVLLSPVLDLRRSQDDDAPEPVRTILANTPAYLAGVDASSPSVSPLLADLNGLPWLLVQFGSADPYAEDARALVAAASSSGVAATEEEWLGMPHRWQLFPHIYDATRAIHRAGDFLLQRIGPGSVPVVAGRSDRFDAVPPFPRRRALAVRLLSARFGAESRAARLEGDELVLLDAPDVGALLASGPKWTSIAKQDGPHRKLSDATLARLIPAPEKIICVGLNYRSHAQETGHGVPEFPTIFAKYSRALLGPHDDLVLPNNSSMVDWEAELAVVIGSPARHVAEPDARAAIAGYTVANDISMRDWQRKTSQWLQGKTFEATTPVGPPLSPATRSTIRSISVSRAQSTVRSFRSRPRPTSSLARRPWSPTSARSLP